MSIIVLGLVTGFIPPPKHVMADSSHIVSLYFDGQKRVITTDTKTVGEVLSQNGVKISDGDLVEPGVDTQIPEGFFNINVYRARPVVVVDGQKQLTIKTALQSPKLISEAVGITVYPEDGYQVTTIDDPADIGVVGQKVTIDRATPVIVRSDGADAIARTQQATVGGLLDERDVALGPQDTVSPGRDTKISANMVVQINRIKVAVIQQTQSIPRTIQTIKDDSVDAGVSAVKTEGSDGTKVTTFRVHYQNGIEKGREQLSQSISAQPVTKVVVVGTRINYGADPVNLGRQMAAARGWTGDQWTALYSLWDRESGWDPNSRNFWSGACGIPQAYPCSKISDHSTAGQITWGLNYIAGKYGNPSNAWAYWLRNHSY